jgi:energy-coupling factor transporter ATP-binding protein EcfA2
MDRGLAAARRSGRERRHRVHRGPALAPAARAGLVQFVGQVPMQQLSGFAFTVFDEITFGPCNLGLPEAEIRARAEAAIALCNLDHLRGRDPFSLSGGEQQRLSIAAALAMGSRALVLDEPTGNFDPESRDALLAQMAALPAGMTTIWCDVVLGAALRVGHPRTAEIFGLPAVAEAARLLGAQGLWPGALPHDAQAAAARLAPMLEEAP